jgi:2-polyprenyl-3-methyl-5-hydroxy-6-metoxy-1,4-benzoquinol methylase
MTGQAAVENNRRAWDADRYVTWVAAIGEPASAAATVAGDPRHVLRRLIGPLDDVTGRRVLNLQGSHGRVALALALLGADVTVIDFAEQNQRYALALAEAASVAVDYRCADVMTAPQLGLGAFDDVVMELGILHYHHDLAAFFAMCLAMARPGGRLLLNDFHPVQRKLFAGDAMGDYFDARAVEGLVPTPPGLPPSREVCTLRRWTLGEILTALLGAGWTLTSFAEHPDWDDPRIPGTYTLSAIRGLEPEFQPPT